MAIEIVGDADAIKVLNPAAEKTSDLDNQTKRPGSQLRFKTVAIPDISNQEFVSTSRDRQSVDRENSTSSPTNPSATTVSNLDGIKNSIERSFDGQNDSEDAVDLFSDLDSIPQSIDKMAPLTDTVPTRKRKLKAKEQCPLTELETDHPQITPIVESIVDKYQTGASSVIAFSSTERNEQLEPTILNTAIALHKKTSCKILIIDAELCSPYLSEMMSCDASQGLADIAKGGNTWEQLLETTSIADIEFLPAGQSAIATTEKLNGILKKTISKFTGQYDYILVNIGDAHEEIARIWANYTSGTFLLVSMNQTNRDIAKSAVAQLTNFGARLIGCIVTDVEDED